MPVLSPHGLESHHELRSLRDRERDRREVLLRVRSDTGPDVCVVLRAPRDGREVLLRVRAPLPIAQARPVETPKQEPVAERRLVSVLFADLVGFTTASEGRDAEDTRELLTRYFDTSRTIIERYGGTVEKFIGDAVMAVWGAPVANEDDAERAVRAALELVAAVPALDPALKARAGVLTGEAAVTLGATDQGMVAGDLVNTASRIQSAAEPDTVLVGETTRRATEAAISYADAEEHEVKGKSEPVPLWRAVRVRGESGRRRRAAGLEAPFVGRTGELRLVKDLFHASADQSRARLVSVIGVAGIGKSRLAWEFEKYIDGVAGGRLVAPRSLPLLRRRRRLLGPRGDGPRSREDPRGRGRTRVGREGAGDARGSGRRRRRAFPHRAGAPPPARTQRANRLGARGSLHCLAPLLRASGRAGPLVLVFEDIHWADEGLIAFIEHLLDWGRHHPIFVLTLARPELSDRHPGFPGSNRSAATLPLEPLSDDAMDELLVGLVPGSPTMSAGAFATRPTGSRCTPSRRCACCAIAACSSASATTCS